MKMDNTIREKPECAVENCKEDALVLVGGKFICGKCCKKWHEKNQKLIFSQVENAAKG
jgi:hypothetical protein